MLTLSNHVLFIRGQNIIYDEKGYVIEKNVFNPDGSLLVKNTYKYNDKGNEIEANESYKDSPLFSKTTYQYDYDEIGNWIMRYEFTNENTKNRRITEREIEYH